MNRPVILLLLPFYPMVISAQKAAEPDSLPSWVLYGLGQQAYEQSVSARPRCISDVLSSAAASIRRPKPRWPRSPARVKARRFQEAQLQKAIDEQGLLQVPDDRYALLYALADLRLRTDPGASVEKGEAALETWRQILKDDEPYQAAQAGEDSRGLLQRLDGRQHAGQAQDGPGPQPHGEPRWAQPADVSVPAALGFSAACPSRRSPRFRWLTRPTSRPSPKALFALVGIFSTVIVQVKAIHPEYSFRGLDELFIDKASDYYIGKPEGLESTRSAGSANPGWLVRYQPVWGLSEVSERHALARHHSRRPRRFGRIKDYRERTASAHRGQGRDPPLEGRSFSRNWSRRTWIS